MAALTEDRPTPQRSGVDFVDPVAAAATIYAGALVVLDASGNAAPGSTATGLKARGVALERSDNSAGAAGAQVVRSRAGVFRFATADITRANIGGTAYIVDDQTVAATDGTATRSAAGTVVDVDASGVWIRIG